METSTPKNELRVGLLSMELHENRQANTVGSSRIRGTWLIKNWPDAELFKIGKRYDAVIFQKAYHLEFMKAFEGVKIFDICDPDWLDGKPVKEAIELCDAVTTSTEALAEYLRTITDKPVVCVPDRVDMTEHQARKVHEGRARSAVWFGYHHNQMVVDQALSTLKRLGLQLTVVSDMPYYPQGVIAAVGDDWIKANVRNVKYDYSTICDELVASGDMLINPRFETGRFKYKSNNKTLTAWACGIPVANDAEEMEKYMEEAARKEEADKRLEEIRKDWDVSLSVKAYQDLIADIASKPRPLPAKV